MMRNFVEVPWLAAHLNDENTVIIDCRFNLFDAAYGKKVYAEGHIAKAFFLDMNKDLSGEKSRHGGVRPLPDMLKFKAALERIGVHNDSVVVIYDDGLNAAPRLWWLLKYVGHQACCILNGGIKAWLAQGYPQTGESPVAKQRGTLDLHINHDLACDMSYVQDKQGSAQVVLVDARSFERFSGLCEPLYAKAGHIPGAINLPWQNCVSNGFIHSHAELNSQLAQLLPFAEIIVYCGSGIAACGTYLALAEVGVSSKVYLGGFSDWITYEENPIE